MVEMKVVDLSGLDKSGIEDYFVKKKEFFPSEVEDSVQSILKDVAIRGDRALIEHTEKYDNVTLSPGSLRVKPSEIESLSAGFSFEFSHALRVAVERVREFHQKERVEEWSFMDELGNRLGQKCTPLKRVGIYIPGGKASYPSTLVMTVIPAITAGVEEIVLISPPSSFKAPSALALAVKIVGGISEIYRVGGVQGIAALGFGTQSIKQVDKIVGPGNIYVAVAKKLLYGYVDIDMVAGPSEVLIIADGTVEPKLTAVDLVAQAEHDQEARAFCVAYSNEIAFQINEWVKKLIQISPRKEIIRESIFKNGKIFIVRGEDEAALVADAISPEHLEIHTSDPEKFLKKIRNAGAIFLGKYSPEAMGDYVAGPSHVLPTAGTARFFSPLSILSFVKFSSIINMSKQGFEKLGKYASIIAQVEGLDEHANSVFYRKEES